MGGRSRRYHGISQSKPEPGRLCADHGGRPWGHDGCGAEGSRCVCNPAGAIFGEALAEVEDFTADELAEAARALTPEELDQVAAARALRDRPLH